MSVQNEIKTRIKLKRDTETNWEAASDKTILNGEVILVDSDDGRLRAKIGDGQTAYSGLGFVDHIHIVTEDNKEDPIPANAILVVDTTEEDLTGGFVGGGTGGSGEGGVSPTISVTTITGGHRVSITDVNGTKSFKIMDGIDGKDGSDGSDGSDGYSPTVSVSSITGGNKVTITDADGPKSFNIMNGRDGTDGSDGKDGTDGRSPTVSISAIEGGSTVTFTDVNGPQSVDIMHGKAPERGTDYWTEADKAEIKSYVDAAILGGEW